MTTIVHPNSCSSFPHLVSESQMASWRMNMLDSQFRPRITSLFWETRKMGREEDLAPMFTTKDRNHTVPNQLGDSLITYPSLKQIYMTYDHVPEYEYEFALDVFGSWDHWNKLCKSTLKEMFAGWREELAIKLKAAALKKMMHASFEPTSTGINAAKYLADEGYVAAKRGRVSKADKERQAKIAAGVNEDLKDDMARLGLEVINGSK